METANNDKFGKRCVNQNCFKTHCANHSRNRHFLSAPYDFNPENKFMCPQYVPLFKHRNGYREKTRRSKA